jgi:hypothetical protein
VITVRRLETLHDHEDNIVKYDPSSFILPLSKVDELAGLEIVFCVHGTIIPWTPGLLHEL